MMLVLCLRSLPIGFAPALRGLVVILELNFKLVTPVI